MKPEFSFQKLNELYRKALSMNYQVIHENCLQGRYYVHYKGWNGKQRYCCAGCGKKMPDIMVLQWRLLESE